MITPAFGLTATERVLPKLALDFTTASLDSRITFTRTTDTLGTLPTGLTSMSIGGTPVSNAQQLNGYIRKIAYFPQN